MQTQTENPFVGDMKAGIYEIVREYAAKWNKGYVKINDRTDLRMIVPGGSDREEMMEKIDREFGVAVSPMHPRDLIRVGDITKYLLSAKLKK